MRYCTIYGGYGYGSRLVHVEMVDDKICDTYEEAFDLMIREINRDARSHIRDFKGEIRDQGTILKEAYRISIYKNNGQFLMKDGSADLRYKIVEIPDKKVTLKEYLDSNKDIECDLAGNRDLQATFIWEDIELTEEGYKKFKPIMDCEVDLAYEDSGYVEVLVGDDPNDELTDMLDEFALSVAGYCSNSDYDKWFKEL